MLDRKQWTSSPMPNDVIARVPTLAKNSPVGLHFTNMRYKEHADDEDSDSDTDSDDDSNYDSDDDSSDQDDDDYDNFIEGVNGHNANPPDPPDANVDENNNDEDEDDEDDEDNALQDEDEDDEDDEENVLPEEFPNPPETDELPETDIENNNDADEDEAPVLPSQLEKLTECHGALPPVIESRTQSKATNGNTLVANEVEWIKPANKKQRREKRDLQKQALQ
jgi:hypothetical protein